MLKDIYYSDTEEKFNKIDLTADYDTVGYFSDYCKENNITVHYNSSAPEAVPDPGAPSGNKRGDINGDGKTDLTDIMALLKKYVAGTSDSAMDYNGDGKVDLTDVIQLLGDYVNGRI